MGRATGVFSRVTSAFFYLLNGELVTPFEKVRTGTMQVGYNKYDIRDMPFESKVDLSSHFGNDYEIKGALMSEDGTKLYFAHNDNDHFDEWTLSTPYDLSTATLTNTNGPGTWLITGMDWDPIAGEGNAFYCVEHYGDISRYEFSTPYDITTITKVEDDEGDTLNQTTGGISVGEDGQNMIVSRYAANLSQINHLYMNTPGDLSTLEKIATIDLYPEIDQMMMVSCKDGINLTCCTTQSNGKISKYKMSKWDVTTLKHQFTHNINSQDYYEGGNIESGQWITPRMLVLASNNFWAYLFRRTQGIEFI
jgi:hypothetical protein